MSTNLVKYLLDHKWSFLISFLTIMFVVISYFLLELKEAGGSNYRFHTLKYERTIEMWKTLDLTEHRFLSYTQESLHPYLSRPMLWSLSYVAYHTFFTMAFDLASHWSTYVLFIAFGAFGVCTLTIINFDKKYHLAFVGAFLLFFGLVVFSSNAFHYYYYFDHDNLYSLLGISYGCIAALHVQKSLKSGGYFQAIFLIPLILFGHLGALTFLMFFVFFEKTYLQTKWFAIALVVMMVSIFLPYILGDPSLYGSGSSIRLRSGLDGSTFRMSNHLQALLWPDWQGGSTPLMRWIPILSSATLIVAFSAFQSLGSLRENLSKFARILSIALIGYLPDFIIFPQSVSIHPYLYDFGWMMPLHIATGVFILNSAKFICFKTGGLKLFYVGVATVLVAMVNLIHIAQLG